MKKRNDFIISAFTPPPNGYQTIGGETIYMGQDFRTEERYKEYRACGLNVIIFAGENKYQGEDYETSDLKKMLDLSAKADLKAVVFDERIMALTVQAKTSIIEEKFGGDKAKFHAFVKDCLSTYCDHPAFFGVAILDEPFIAKAPVIQEFTDAVYAFLPDAFVHTCCLPCIQELGLNADAFGKGYATIWDSYDAYVDAMSGVGLGYYGYDAYPFGMWENKNVVAPMFFRNMKHSAAGAVRNGVPFHMTIQSFSAGANDDYRRVDESDLNWQSNLALGFGAKSFYYYTYWVFTTRAAKESQTSAIIDEDGTRQIYDEVQRNNALICRIFGEIKDYTYKASKLLDGAHDNPATKDFVSDEIDFVKSHESDSVLLMTKLSKADGDVYMVLNVRDPYEKEVNRVRLKMQNPKPEYEVMIRGRRMTLKGEGEYLTFTLEPGEALFIFD